MEALECKHVDERHAGILVGALLEDGATAEMPAQRAEIKILPAQGLDHHHDIILISDYSPVYIGTIGPKHSVWRVLKTAPNVGRKMRTALHWHAPTKEECALRMVEVMRPFWKPIIDRHGLALESEDVDPKEFAMQPLDNGCTLRERTHGKYTSTNEEPIFDIISEDGRIIGSVYYYEKDNGWCGVRRMPDGSLHPDYYAGYFPTVEEAANYAIGLQESEEIDPKEFVEQKVSPEADIKHVIEENYPNVKVLGVTHLAAYSPRYTATIRSTDPQKPLWHSPIYSMIQDLEVRLADMYGWKIRPYANQQDYPEHIRTGKIVGIKPISIAYNNAAGPGTFALYIDFNILQMDLNDSGYSERADWGTPYGTVRESDEIDPKAYVQEVYTMPLEGGPEGAIAVFDDGQYAGKVLGQAWPEPSGLWRVVPLIPSKKHLHQKSFWRSNAEEAVALLKKVHSLAESADDIDPKDFVERQFGRLRTLHDLQKYPDDQVFLCNDPVLMKEHNINEPFKCYNVYWRGRGCVSIEFYEYRKGELSLRNETALITSLTPIVDESVKDEIDQEAAKAEEPASEEQAEAGNYKKGHVSIQGMEIAIETAKGGTREGKDKSGKPWKVTLPAHYGYLKGTVGKDKDHLDVYIGDNPGGMLVFVVNQNHLEGGFDEHKILLGFASKDEAIETYDKAYSGSLGPKLRGSVVSSTVDKLKEWIASGNTKKPFENAVAESFVAWHSSPERFRRFDTSREGAHFGTREQAENLRKPGKLPAKPYLLDIKNPLRVRDLGTWTLDGIATELFHEDVISQDDYNAIREEYNQSDERGFAKVKAILAEKGYDGFVYANEQEGQGDSFVAFYSSQIKPVRESVSSAVVDALLESDGIDPKEFANDTYFPRTYGELKPGMVLYTETGAYERVERVGPGRPHNHWYQGIDGELLSSDSPGVVVDLTEFSPCYAYGRYKQQVREHGRAGLVGTEVVSVPDNSDEALWAQVDAEIAERKQARGVQESDDIDPKEFVNNIESPVVLEPVPGNPDVWEVYKKQPGGRYPQRLGNLHFDLNENPPPGANPAWKETNWFAAPLSPSCPTRAFASKEEAEEYLLSCAK